MASSLPPSSQIYFIVMVGLLISFHQATASFQCNEVWSKKATSRQSQWRRGCSLNSLPIMEQYDDFLIRDCRYTDLPPVSEILLHSFYAQDKLASPWKHMYRLSELNRLQQNFPYDDSRHRMLVAVMKDPAPTSSRTNLDGSTRRASPSPQQERIVAFCDFDARPATRWQDPPRPYLSDLAVDAGFRRRGIARALIELCERMVVETLNQSSLYMRVERDNSNAMTMYQKLLYQPQAHTIFGVKDTTVLLCKPLVVTPSTVTSTCSVTN